MSSSGVANIMAYSWPSHCKRYLDSLDSELRFLKSYRVGEGWGGERVRYGVCVCRRGTTGRVVGGWGGTAVCGLGVE